MSTTVTAFRNVVFTIALICGVAGLAQGGLGWGIPLLLYAYWFSLVSVKVTAHLGYCPHCQIKALNLYFKETDYDSREWEDSGIFESLLHTATDFEERGGREFYFTKNHVFLSTFHCYRSIRSQMCDPNQYHYYGCDNCGKRYRRNREIDLIGRNWFDATEPQHDWAYRRGTMKAQLKFYTAPLTPVILDDLKLLRQRGIEDLEFYYGDLIFKAEWNRLKSLMMVGCEIWEYQSVTAEYAGYVYGDCGVALVRWVGNLAKVEESEWLRLPYPQFVYEPCEILGKVRQGYFRAATDSWYVR